MWKGARHFRVLSAANGDVERLFSHAQRLLEQKRRRGRLLAETQQELLLLCENGAALGLRDFGGPCGEGSLGVAETQGAKAPEAAEEAGDGTEDSEVEEEVEIDF